VALASEFGNLVVAIMTWEGRYVRSPSRGLAHHPMGRKGGLDGAELAKDIASGTWRTQLYECSSKPVQNKNWFTVAEFVARLAAAMPPQ
jgi:hypothetical protein